jgi:hypothetical protein
LMAVLEKKKKKKKKIGLMTWMDNGRLRWANQPYKVVSKEYMMMCAFIMNVRSTFM